MKQARVPSSSLGLYIKKMRRQIGHPIIIQFVFNSKEIFCIQVLEFADELAAQTSNYSRT